MRKAVAYWPLAMVVLIAMLATFLLSRAAKAQGTGEKSYKAKCAMCRGPDGKGQTPTGKSIKVRDLCSGEGKGETDDRWAEIFHKGKNKMPAYDKKLSEAEIKDVIVSMRGLCKEYRTRLLSTFLTTREPNSIV